jgi:hypothetical protein
MRTANAVLQAILIVSVLTASAATQPLIGDPSRCAQFYPNANCQNEGPGSWFSRTYRTSGWRSGYDSVGPHENYNSHRRRHHR